MTTRPGVNREQEQKLQMESKTLCCELPAMTGLGQAMSDRYRCPEDLFDFELREQLSSSSGYFQFGPNGICYGRSCSGAVASRPESTVQDLAEDVTFRGGKLFLPFDPAEIIENLRLERYAGTPQKKSGFRTPSPKVVLQLSTSHEFVHAETNSKISFPELEKTAVSPVARGYDC